MAKQRVDILLVGKGLAESREKAKRIVLTGVVFSGERRIDKPGTLLDESAPLTIKEDPEGKYVSRGGLKLEFALDQFNLNVQDLICADVGASTGGFTDCLLQHGASKVYAIDVGHGQLDYGLRNDPRVIVHEKVNARYLSEGSFPEKVDFITIDVSFISLTKILPPVKQIGKPRCGIICLVKPQFEVGRKEASRNKGIIRSDEARREVIDEITRFTNEIGITVIATIQSPIKGASGNIEYLMYAINNK